MVEFHGKEGRIQLPADDGAEEIALHVRKWTINREVELIWTATLDTATGIKTKRSYVGFHKDSGSFEGYLVSGAGPVLTEFDGLLASATFESGDGTTYTGNIIITNLTIDNPVDDVGVFSATFDVEGVMGNPV